MHLPPDSRGGVVDGAAGSRGRRAAAISCRMISRRASPGRSTPGAVAAFEVSGNPDTEGISLSAIGRSDYVGQRQQKTLGRLNKIFCCLNAKRGLHHGSWQTTGLQHVQWS